MRFTRRCLTIAAAAAVGAALLPAVPAVAQGGDEAAVNAAVEALRNAMMAADKAQLMALAHDKLSYSHSSGKTETKAEYSDAIASKKSIFKTITLTEPSTSVVGNNAIVRHTFASDVDRGGGKVDAIKIGVLQVWTKDGGKWLLLARQGYKL